MGATSLWGLYGGIFNFSEPYGRVPGAHGAQEPPMHNLILLTQGIMHKPSVFSNHCVFHTCVFMQALAPHRGMGGYYL